MITYSEIFDHGYTATLTVAWRSGKSAHGRMVKAGGEVIGQLCEYAKTSLKKTHVHKEPAEYDPNDEMDEETSWLHAKHDELLDTALLDQITKGASLEQISSSELKKSSSHSMHYTWRYPQRYPQYSSARAVR